MADFKIELKNSLNSKMYPKTTLDNIVKSVASSTTFITSGGVIKKDYLDLTDVNSAITGLQNNKQNMLSISSDSWIDLDDDWLSIKLSKSIKGPYSSGTVVLYPQEAYKIYATNNIVTLDVFPNFSTSNWGLEGHAEIFVANVGSIHTTNKVVLATALEPDSVNNCTIRFHDGIAILSVEDNVAGYIVKVASGSTNGSLAYGLSTATNEYISVDASLNSQTLDLAGVTTRAGEKHVVGNGYDKTILSGGITCTSKTTFSNLSMLNVVVKRGTLTFSDAYIPSGSTVSVSGGGLAVEKATGNGGVINLGGTHIVIPSAATAYMYGVQITGGSASTGGAFLVSGTMHLESCVISGNTASTGGGIQNTKPVYLSNCIVSGNTRTGNQGRDIYPINSTAEVILLGGNKVGEIMLTNSAKVYLSGSNTVDSIVSRAAGTSRMGFVTISSGAIVDLTGNANAIPIRPGLGITFGANVTVINSAGQSVLLNGGAAGSCSSIKNDGTTT